eukprot:COSAG01_NODE_75957_length_191_cov_44.456522_1_plen_22_part_01
MPPSRRPAVTCPGVFQIFILNI